MALCSVSTIGFAGSEDKVDGNTPDSKQIPVVPDNAQTGTYQLDQTIHSPAAKKNEDKDSLLKPILLKEDTILLGGYFQPGFTFVRDTPFNVRNRDGFVFQNARLTGEGHLPITSWLNAGFLFNFDVGTGVFLVRDVFGSLYLKDKTLALDLGQMKVPFTLAEMVSQAKVQFAVHTPVRTRTNLLRGAALSQGRDRGVRLRLGKEVGGVWLHAEGGIFNGEGENALENQDSKFLYAGRIEIGPLGRVPLDEPDLENSAFQIVVGGSLSYTPSLATNSQGIGDAGAKDTRYAVDARLRFRGLSMRGEFIQSKQNGQNAEQNISRYGMYVQGGYVLPLPFKVQFEPVIRWAQYDNSNKSDGISRVVGTGGTQIVYDLSDNSEIRMIDVGFNTYLMKHRLKLQVVYRLTDFLEGPKTDQGLRQFTQTGQLGNLVGKGQPLIGDALYAVVQFGWL
jgi:hypothetical protein